MSLRAPGSADGEASRAVRAASCAGSIRRAGLDDAFALSRIATDTFAQTFGHLYPPEDLAHFVRTHYSLEACARVLSDPQCAAWLASIDGVIVGHALAGPCSLPHADVVAGDGELKRLYLLPQAQNGGLGGQLCQLALDWLDRDGPRRIWISVWSGNHGAQRFYARRGFARVADYEFIVGRQRDHEYMYRRDAQPTNGPPSRLSD